MRKPIIFLSALLLPVTAAASTSRPFEPTLQGSEYYGETFSAVADLQGGHYLQVQLAFSNIGPGDGKGACRILFVPANGPTSTEGNKVGRDGWRYQPSKTGGRLTVGACFAETHAANTIIVAKLEGQTVKLTIDGTPKSVIAPDAEIKVDDAFYRVEMMIPSAPVQVERTVSGKTQKMVGHVYLDHSQSTTLPKQLASRWVRVRSLGAQTRLALLRFPPKSDTAVGWAMKAPTAPQILKRAGVKRRNTPNGSAYRVQLQAGKHLWRATTTKLLYRHAPVEDQGILGAVVGKVVGNPVTYTYRAVLEEPGTKTKVPGIVEVTVVDERRR